MRSLGVLLVLAVFTGSATAQMKPLRLRVVDEKNRPVAGATVSSQWGFDNNRWSGYGGITTDRHGRAAKDVYLSPQGSPILAWNEDQTLCGLTVVKQESAAQEVIIRLEAPARIKLMGQSLIENRAIALSGVFFDEDRHVIGQVSRFQDGWMSIPSGTRSVVVSSVDHVEKAIEIDLGPGESRDFGRIVLDWNNSKKLEGRPSPAFAFEDQKNLPPSFKISDYLGSWVVLEFWGWWCGPCVGRGVPSAIVLHELAQRENLPVKVLGIHEIEANTVNEVESKLARIKSQNWGGRDLPFGWVVDADGSIAESFGVRGYPTTILIDPKGIVVGQRRDAALAKAITALTDSQRLEWALAEPLPMYFSDCSVNGFLQTGILGFDVEIDESTRPMLNQVGDQKFGTYVIQGSKGSAFNLILEGTGLCWDVNGGKVRIRPGVQPEWTGPFADSREREFARLLAERPSLEFKGTIDGLTAYMADRIDPSPVLRPADVIQGLIQPGRKVHFKTNGGTIWDELTRLLEPMGLRLAIRHEALLIESIRSR